MKKTLFLIILTALYTALFGWGSGAGTTGSNYLKIAPFARAAALGDAFVAVSDGTYGLFYNPAGLNTILGYEAQLSHISWFQGINYDYMAIVNPDPLLSWGKIGLAVSYIQAGDMSHNSDLPFYDTGYLNSGVDLLSFTGDKFTPKSYSVIFGYSLDPLEELSVGLNIRLSTDYLGEYKDSNVTCDLGAMYKQLVNGHYLRGGLVIGNIGTKATMSSESFDQPFDVIMGVSDLTQLFGCEFLLTSQVTLQIDDIAQFGFGAEYWFFDMYALRAGINIGHTLQPSAGAGIKYKNFELDYAFVNYDVLGATHRFSLLFSWGTPPARLAVAPFLISPNNDGYLDKAYFTPILQEISLVTSVWINIYDEKGLKLLMRIPAKKPSDKKIEWDGAKDKVVFKDGVYKASVTAEYVVNGASESNKIDVEIDNTPPETSMEAGPVYKRPGREDALLIPVTFTFFAKDKNGIDRWQLVIWNSDKNIFYSTSGRGMPPISVTWDGKGNDGSYAKTSEEYYYSFIAYDTLNNRGQTPVEKKLLLVREIKIVFSSDALFDAGTADVKVSAYKMVKDSKSIIEQFPGTELIVAGHTDNIMPSGKTYIDNIELSQARADAVRFFMINFMGLDPKRIIPEGRADRYPIAPNDTPENRAKNRRVEIIIRSTVYK
jgi:flagellar motor protein MotB